MLTWFEKAETKTDNTNFTWIYFVFPKTALYFHISIRVFCTPFIDLVFDGLLQSV